MKLETPPSSVHGDDELEGEDFAEEEEMIYIGDVDEVLEEMQNDDDNDYAAGSDDEEPTMDNSQLVFSKHVGSVFCGCLHPNGEYAISGGEDDKAYVWNVQSGEVLLQCSEHSDSVVVASFSFDGAFLATADMSGLVQVRRCPGTPGTGSWDVVWSNQIGDLSWGYWHPAAHVLICCATSGEVYVWKMPSGEAKILQNHGEQAPTSVLLRDGKRLAVGYEDSSIKIWDLKTATCTYNITNDPSENSAINAMDSFHDNNLIIAGCLDGKIMLIKSNTGKIIGNLKVDSTVESIKFSKDPSLGFFAVGTLNGSLTIWDVARQTLRYNCSSGEGEDAVGITYVMWINNYVVAAYLNGCSKIFDGKSGNLVHTLSGHKSEILDMSYSSASNTLMTMSEDGTCRIYKLDLPAV